MLKGWVDPIARSKKGLLPKNFVGKSEILEKKSDENQLTA
jgi:hypothetical protein